MAAYRPTRSQQLLIAQAIREKHPQYSDNYHIIVHHVIDENFLTLTAQVEIRPVFKKSPRTLLDDPTVKKILSDPFHHIFRPRFVRLTI